MPTRPILLGKGKAQVSISGFEAEAIERDLKEAMGPVFDEIEKEGLRLLRRAQARWPVGRTGRSRQGLKMAMRLHPGTLLVEAHIYNDAVAESGKRKGKPYHQYIRSTKIGYRQDATRLRSPIVTELREPAKETKKVLVKTLPDILARHLKGNGDG